MDDTSRILVAVSATSDPTGSWNFTAIDSKIAIGGVDHWADYPGLAVCEDAIYITNNMFTLGAGANGGSRLWIIDKSPFYSGGPAVVTVHDPVSSSGGFNVNLAPAHIYGSGATLPGGAAGTTGTWLCGYSGLSSGTTEALQFIRIDNPLNASPTFTLTTPFVSDFDDTSASFPNAPQPGSSGGLSEIETNDRRMLQAVWRGGNLYAVTTVVPGSGADAGQATAHWFRLTTGVGTLTAPVPADEGNVGGEDIQTGAHTFFPSIAVNKHDDMAICFSLSGSSTFAGGYYASRAAGDAAGTISSSVVFAAGLSAYRRTFGGSRNRWGDYAGLSVDPSDDETFWAFNQCAKSGTDADTEDGKWGTRFGSFTESVPVELDMFAID